MLSSSVAFVSGFAPAPLAALQQPHLQQPAVRMALETM